MSPGPIYFDGGPWDSIKQNAPDVYQDALEQCVIGRLGTPDEVASTIANAVINEVVAEAAREILKAKASEKIDSMLGRDKD